MNCQLLLPLRQRSTPPLMTWLRNQNAKLLSHRESRSTNCSEDQIGFASIPACACLPGPVRARHHSIKHIWAAQIGLSCFARLAGMLLLSKRFPVYNVCLIYQEGGPVTYGAPTVHVQLALYSVEADKCRQYRVPQGRLLLTFGTLSCVILLPNPLWRMAPMADGYWAIQIRG
eukprot:526136-Amphidinium_carterae.4